MSQEWWEAAREVSMQRGGDYANQLRHLLRLGLIAQLESKGWFRWKGSTDYLRSIWRDLGHISGPYRFDQRLAILFSSGLSQPSRKARELVSQHIGEVPFLGSGLFVDTNPLQFEQFERLHQWFFDGGGVAIAANSIGGSNDDNVVRRCKEIVENSSKNDPVQFHDTSSGNGAFLATLLAAFLDEGWSSVDLLSGALTGISDNVLSASEGTFRLASVALTSQVGSNPEPLPDIRKLVNVRATVPKFQDMLQEGEHLEFKASFEWNTRTNQKDPNIRLGVLRSVAAFLNTNGGRLILGVDNEGTPAGISHELDKIPSSNPEDTFEGKIREVLKTHLDPFPISLVSISFPRINGIKVCEINVHPTSEVTYVVRKGDDGRQLEEIYVRDGNRTIGLSGRTRDRFVSSRAKNLRI